MSNVPRAREIIRAVLDGCELSLTARRALIEALGHMTRVPPAFRAKAELPPLTRKQVRDARRLRAAGRSLHSIMLELGTNIGRVSEAVNGLQKGKR